MEEMLEPKELTSESLELTGAESKGLVHELETGTETQC